MVTYYRRLPKFAYLKPGSMDEALQLLGKGEKEKILVYAGGTDVIPKLKGRLINAPEALLDIKGIPDLDYISYDDKTGLKIGALASIYAVANAAVVRKQYPILSQAAKSIASTQVQNRGTLVGNICNAVPSADSAPALLCLDAKVVCVSKGGARTVALEKFFAGPNLTDLRADEIVKEIQIPPMIPGSGGVYIKLSPRRKMDCALVGVAVVIAADNGVFRNVRIGLGAVAPTPIRALKAEQRLIGEPISEAAITEAAKAASIATMPIADHRASAEYRRMMVEVLVKRAIYQIHAGNL